MIVQIDSALGEIQFALLLSLLQQTQVTELFLEKKKKKKEIMKGTEMILGK